MQMMSYQNGCYQRQQITSIGKDIDKRESLCTVGGIINWCSDHGIQYAVFKKIKNKTTTQLSISISRNLCEENINSNIKRYMQIFRAA